MGHRRSASPFLEEVRRAIRVRHYSLRTEDAYLGWIKRFILFHGKRHPAQMGETEVGAFLTELAVWRRRRGVRESGAGLFFSPLPRLLAQVCANGISKAAAAVSQALARRRVLRVPSRGLRNRPV